MEKKSNTTERLKEIMEIKNLRQVDILDLCQPFSEKYDIKMNKSDLSQYLSGKSEPNQNKLFILAKALNVSEAWLMGLDHPMERQEVVPQTDLNDPIMVVAAHHADYDWTEEELAEVDSFINYVKSKKNK